MPNTDERATDQDIEALRDSIKETNESKKRDKLTRQITRAHEWRVQVWAQSELRIRAANASLAALGGDPIEPFEPQFDDDEMLHHYSNMPLSK